MAKALLTWVSFAIGALVVHLASIITAGNVHLGEVTNTSDLDVFRGLDEVNTLESAFRDNASAAAGLGAPGDSDALSATNSTGVRGTPEAEVGQRAIKGVRLGLRRGMM